MKVRICVAMALIGAVATQGVEATESSITNFLPDSAVNAIKNGMETQIQERMEKKIIETGKEMRKGKIVQTHSKSYFKWLESPNSLIVFGAVCVKVALPGVAPSVSILAEKLVGTEAVEKLTIEQIKDIMVWAKSTTKDIPENFKEPKDVLYSDIGNKLTDVLNKINVDSSNVPDVVKQLEEEAKTD
jgi:hypothetical protein